MELVNTDAAIEAGVEEVKDDLIPGSLYVRQRDEGDHDLAVALDVFVRVMFAVAAEPHSLRGDKADTFEWAVCGPPLASAVAITTADPIRRFSHR